MDESTIAKCITALTGLETTTAFGYTFFFYQSERELPFATLIAADTEYDRISNLDRPGVFRLNIVRHSGLNYSEAKYSPRRV